MKILFFWAYYQPVLDNFYAENPLAAELNYSEQLELLLQLHFGNAYGQRASLRELGHEVEVLITNCKPLQKRWALEHGFPFDEVNWQLSIPYAQTKGIRPDVFFIGSMFLYYGRFIQSIREYCGRVIGWISCPIPRDLSFDGFSMFLSSSVPIRNILRDKGLRAEHLPADFDPKVLDKLPASPVRDIPFSFVGSVSPAHGQRYKMITGLVENTPLELWGSGYGLPSLRGVLLGRPSVAGVFRDLVLWDKVHRRYRGEAWGLDMYRILQRSKITFNIHIDIAGDFACNMRLYEATGVGTLLLTDKKNNLDELFVPGVEAVSYDSVYDAIDKVHYFLENDAEREALALKGQARTFQQYTTDHTMRRMIQYFEGVLSHY